MTQLNIPNLDKLIAHLEAQPPEKFNMADVFVKNGVVCDDLRREMHNCGTAACIVGWIYTIAALPIRREDANKWLGVSYERGCQLFTPRHYEETSRYPLHRAISTLKRLRDRFLATGEIVVDWGPEPGEEPPQPWSAPQAVELSPPALPAEITRLLAPVAVTEEADHG